MAARRMVRGVKTRVMVCCPVQGSGLKAQGSGKIFESIVHGFA
jgi:hypothetical protein